jgi:hypothetical protein
MKHNRVKRKRKKVKGLAGLAYEHTTLDGVVRTGRRTDRLTCEKRCIHVPSLCSVTLRITFFSIYLCIKNYSAVHNPRIFHHIHNPQIPLYMCISLFFLFFLLYVYFISLFRSLFSGDREPIDRRKGFSYVFIRLWGDSVASSGIPRHSLGRSFVVHLVN